MSEFLGEHEHEPLRGFPGSLPAGETLLWQGQPLAWTLAWQMFPLRIITLYFLLFAGWRVSAGLQQGLAPGAIAVGVLIVLLMAALIVAALAGYAALIARGTVFSITDRRVLVRFGLTLPKTWNVPFAAIQAVYFKPCGTGRSVGDLCLEVSPAERIPYVLLWPYARPWKLRHPQPLLRALPDGERAAAVLGRALSHAGAAEARAAVAGSATLPAPAFSARSIGTADPA